LAYRLVLHSFPTRRSSDLPLRCVYCDTEYAFSGGERQSLEAIITTIKSYPCKRICLTGGEPLAQPNAIELMQRLLNEGYEISLEDRKSTRLNSSHVKISYA